MIRQRRGTGVGSLTTETYSLGVTVSESEVGDAGERGPLLQNEAKTKPKRSQISVDSKRGESGGDNGDAIWVGAPDRHRIAAQE